jgi:hypothetical protein
MGVRLFVVVLLTLILAEFLIFSRILEVTRYELKSDKVDAPFTIALIADHHSSRWGEEQEGLLRHIRTARPDLVLLAGDMFCCRNSTPESRREALTLIAAVIEIAPTYYVWGNHEQSSTAFAAIVAEVAALGAVILYDEFVEIEVNGNPVIIAAGNGFSTDATHSFGSQIRDSDSFTIMLTHYPERHAMYPGFDLMTAGHAHGGQVRIPLIAPQGLYAPGQGIFPKYTGGMYELDDVGTLIVSRGVSLVSSARTRFSNRPELVFIEVG